MWEVMLGGRMRPYDDATARLLEATLANGQDSAQVVAANGESYLVIGLQSGSDYHQHPPWVIPRKRGARAAGAESVRLFPAPSHHGARKMREPGGDPSLN